MARLLLSLRIALTLALVLALIWSGYVARSAVWSGFQPEDYTFVIGLLLTASPIFIELVIVLLFIDYFAKAASRRLAATARDHLCYHYNRLLFPLLRDLRDLLGLREEDWERRTSLDGELDRLLEELKKDHQVFQSQFPEITTRLMQLLPADDSVSLLRVVEQIETFTLPDETSPFRAKIHGSMKYQTVYPQILSLAASVAIPLQEFEERFGLNEAGSTLTFHNAVTIIEFAAANRPFSQLNLRSRDGIAIEASVADGFLNEMAAWISISGTATLIGHGLHGEAFDRLKQRRLRAQRRKARLYHLVRTVGAFRKCRLTTDGSPRILCY